MTTAPGEPTRAGAGWGERWRGRWQRRWQQPWNQRWRRSLGLRLVLLFLLLALAMSMTFLFGMRSAFGVGWRDVIRPLVADYVDHLAKDLGSPPDPALAQAMTQRLPLSIRIEGPQVQWSSGPAAYPPPDGARRRGWAAHLDHGHDAETDWLTRRSADGHRIHFGLDTEGWVRQPRMIGLFTLALLLALTALTWGLVHRLFRPVKEIGAGALRYGQGDFSRPIPVRRRDELAEQVNTMSGALSHMLDAKRGLLLAISHELRSPLTRARLNAELVQESPERDALLRDLGQMRDLISDLLESERLAQPHAALQREATDLGELVRALLAGSFAGRAVQVELPAGLPPGWVDRNRLTLLLRNLLDNALRHGAGAASPPELRATLAEGALHLRLRDHGPGVADDQLPRLSEAFHRTDGARQRATGGVGLGLYLCRLVAQAHGGSLSFHAARPGLEVQVRLPWPSPPAAAPGRPDFAS